MPTIFVMLVYCPHFIFFHFSKMAQIERVCVQASPILDAFEVFGCGSNSILLPPFPYPVFGPSMLWEEEEGRLLVCGGSSWRQVIITIIIITINVAIYVNIIIIDIIICDLTFGTRCIQPATAGRLGKLIMPLVYLPALCLA